MNTNKITLLDCTFRDGGYYNQWDFDGGLVRAYLSAMEASGIEIVEIGFRLTPQREFLGAFAYSTDDFLATLNLPKSLTVAVMVNAKELLAFPQGERAAVDALFKPRDRSPVAMVRVAAHFAEAGRCEPIVRRLKELGYRVGFNLMQAAGKPRSELSSIAAAVKGWDAVEVLYFADSLGNMDLKMVGDIVDALREGWGGPLGIHAHNNMGQALANSVAAVEAGVTWVDGTIAGMGRGAGNVNTEYLLLEFGRRGWTGHSTAEVFALAMQDFEKMRRHYGWGPNLLYFLSAYYGVHPTYVQEMLGKGQYGAQHLVAAMEILRESKASLFSNRTLQAVLTAQGVEEGSWSASGWAAGRDVLIVAPGPGAAAHRAGITSFIDRKRPIVVCLNVNAPFPADRVDVYAACHKTCIMMDAQRYAELGKPLLVPRGAVPSAIAPRLADVPLLDYGIRIEPDRFQAGERGCTLPSPLAAGYVIAAAEAGSARKIYLAGFDGYGLADPRQQEMTKLFKLVLRRPSGVALEAVTPTSYDLPRGSVYAPTIETPEEAAQNA